MKNYILTGNLPGWLRDHIMGCRECRAYEHDCHDFGIDINQEVDRILKNKPKKEISFWRTFFLPLILLLGVLIISLLIASIRSQ